MRAQHKRKARKGRSKALAIATRTVRTGCLVPEVLFCRVAALHRHRSSAFHRKIRSRGPPPLRPLLAIHLKTRMPFKYGIATMTVRSATMEANFEVEAAVIGEEVAPVRFTFVQKPKGLDTRRCLGSDTIS